MRIQRNPGARLGDTQRGGMGDGGGDHSGTVPHTHILISASKWVLFPVKDSEPRDQEEPKGKCTSRTHSFIQQACVACKAPRQLGIHGLLIRELILLHVSLLWVAELHYAPALGLGEGWRLL